MAENSTVARPYAEAIFELAKDQSQYKDWSEMLAFAAAVASNEDMAQLIGNTNVNKQQMTELFLGVCEGRLNAEGQNMIKLLVENRRLNVLTEIAQQYETLRAEAEKTIEAEVVSAFEVSKDQQSLIASNLKKRLGREVSLTCRVDESLLGGVVIKAGDLVIDGSSIGQIRKLSVELAG
ncbi:MAG: F0F1 ATP synthase subunit delta [Gammaproteobacteria bacterium]|nr:F0F1 ATP synthase subunit delta [Gammaproteobacteria bacterium]MDH5800226.1 F0F1 ATP synthase subunit delta [Gammaproteobacteria bacterium]